MKKIFLALGIIQSFVAVMAIPAGLSMLSIPDGSGLGISVDVLQDSPLQDFFIPGLFLLVINGGFNVMGAIISFSRNRFAGLMGLVLGLFLLMWIAVQVYWIGWMHFLQVVFLLIAILEIILAAILYISTGQQGNK